MVMERVNAVTVKCITGKEITIDVKDCNTVSDIKSCVAEREGLPADRQRLIHKGRELTDHQTLEAAELTTGAVIHAVPRLHSEVAIQSSTSRAMHIVVYAPASDGRGIMELRLCMEADDSTEVLKGKVEAGTNVAPQDQVLFSQHRPLRDGATLRELGLCDGDVIDCVRRPWAIHSAPVSPSTPAVLVYPDRPNSNPTTPIRGSGEQCSEHVPEFPTMEVWADDEELDLPLLPGEQRECQSLTPSACEAPRTVWNSDACAPCSESGDCTCKSVPTKVSDDCSAPLSCEMDVYKNTTGYDSRGMWATSNQQDSGAWFRGTAYLPQMAASLSPNPPGAPLPVAMPFAASTQWYYEGIEEPSQQPPATFTVSDTATDVQQNDTPIATPYPYAVDGATEWGIAPKPHAQERRRRRGGKNRNGVAKAGWNTPPLQTTTHASGIMPPDYAIVPIIEGAIA